MERKHQSRFLQILSKVLYLAATLVLLLGLIVLIVSFASTANLQHSLIGLLAVAGPALTNLVTAMLRSALINLGVLGFVIALVLSLVLFAAGKLSASAFDLSVRLEKTEQALEQVQRQLTAGNV
jgi:hypothetical protein